MCPSLSSLRSISDGARSMNSNMRSSAITGSASASGPSIAVQGAGKVVCKRTGSVPIDETPAPLEALDLGLDLDGGRIGAVTARDRDPNGSGQSCVVFGSGDEQGGQPLGPKSSESFGRQGFRLGHRRSRARPRAFASSSATGHYSPRPRSLPKLQSTRPPGIITPPTCPPRCCSSAGRQGTS
jgi:hypothetical protein